MIEVILGITIGIFLVLLLIFIALLRIDESLQEIVKMTAKMEQVVKTWNRRTQNEQTNMGQ